VVGWGQGNLILYSGVAAAEHPTYIECERQVNMSSNIYLLLKDQNSGGLDHFGDMQTYAFTTLEAAQRAGRVDYLDDLSEEEKAKALPVAMEWSRHWNIFGEVWWTFISEPDAMQIRRLEIEEEEEST
jgi:hypothetical protein